MVSYFPYKRDRIRKMASIKDGHMISIFDKRIRLFLFLERNARIFFIAKYRISYILINSWHKDSSLEYRVIFILP